MRIFIGNWLIRPSDRSLFPFYLAFLLFASDSWKCPSIPTFHSKLAFMRYKYKKNPRSLCSLEFYKFTIIFSHRADRWNNSLLFPNFYLYYFVNGHLIALLNTIWKSPSIPTVLHQKSLLYRSWFFSSKLLSLYSFPTFYGRAWEPITCSLVPVLFLENVLLSLLFTLNWHLRDINSEFFLARFARSILRKLLLYFPHRTDRWN